MPVFHDAPGSQIKHPGQGTIVGETGFVLHDLPKLTVQTLNAVGGIFDLPNICSGGERGILGEHILVKSLLRLKYY